MSKEYRLVKSLITYKFSVEMFQDGYGRYCIIYSSPFGETQSEWITDFGMASHLFDLKIAELQDGY